MCAIVDANVTFEVFGRKQTEAGVEFRSWLDSDRGSLVVGGKNLEELERNGNFIRWFSEARRLEGRVRQIKRKIMSERQQVLVQGGLLKSDDEHVLALALVSGARLLYTNDGDLKDDFRNPDIISDPEGKVYTTQEGKEFGVEHRELLEAGNLCGEANPR